jgi:hypothetical protein
MGNKNLIAGIHDKDISTDFIHLITIKDGKIVRFQELDEYAAAETIC